MPCPCDRVVCGGNRREGEGFRTDDAALDDARRSARKRRDGAVALIRRLPLGDDAAGRGAVRRREVHHLLAPPAETNAVALPRLPGRKVLCALAESNGVVWVGTDGDGLLRLRPRLVSLRHEVPATNGVVRFTDSTGRVWSGTSADGIRVVSRDGTERHFGTQDGFDARQVTSFAETPDGSVWVGSDGAGLWRVAGDKISRHPCHDGKGNDFVPRPSPVCRTAILRPSS